MNVQLQKHIKIFYEHFEKHVKLWNDQLEDVKKPMSALVNQSEQLRHISKFNVENSEFSQFPDIKSILEYQIKNAIEEELEIIGKIVSKLNKSVQELKTKLTAIENLTLDLDWENGIEGNDDLIIGSATQPPLSKLLQMGYDAWYIYKKIFQNISKAIKDLNFMNEKSTNNLRNVFRIDESNIEKFNYTLAVTQYINNNVDV